MCFTIEQYETDEEWRGARRRGIGASESGALIPGGSRYGSPWSVWVSKIATRLAARRETTAMRLGHAMEPAIIAEFSRSEGLPVRRHERVIFRSVARPWLACSPDGVSGDGATHVFGVDAKNVGASQAEHWEGGAAPIDYIVQCQHSMAVTLFPVWYLAVLIGGNQDFRVVRVERHDAFIKSVLLPSVDRFWRENVEGGAEPAIDGTEATRQALAALYPEDDGEEIVLPEAAVAYHDDLVRLQERLAEISGQIELRKSALKALLQTASIGWLPDGRGGYSNKYVNVQAHAVSASGGRRLKFVKPPAGGRI